MNIIEITRGAFMNNFWEYYLLLEKDFINTLNYVELSEKNFTTYSKEYIKLYQTICSEMDVIFKLVCGFDTNAYKKITNYSTKLLREFGDIVNVKIDVRRTNIVLQPFMGWKPEESIDWWTGYNKIKHNRIINIEQANLRNVLNSLSALYLLEKYLFRKQKFEPDSPEVESSLFKIQDWKVELMHIAGDVWV